MMGYGVLVVDPEGDHLGLGTLPGVTVVGGGDYLPRRRGCSNCSTMTTVPSSSTFSHLDRDHQIVYLAALPVEVDLHRRRTGLPQWVILEEAQRTSGLTGQLVATTTPRPKATVS